MAYNFPDSSAEHMLIASCPISAFPCSMSAWFRADVLGAAPNTVLGWAASGGSTAQCRLYVTSSAIIAAKTGGGNTTTATGGAVSTGVWYFGGATFYTGNNDVWLNTTKTNGTGSATWNTNMDRGGIGVWARSSLTDYWDGDICEPAIWNVQLSDAEMNALAAGACPLTIRPSGLVFYRDLLGTVTFPNLGPLCSAVNSPTVVAHPPTPMHVGVRSAA